MSGSIHCAKCGRLDSSLRVSIFYWVLSLILYSSKQPRVGIWCPGCRRSVGLRYSAIALVFGPWGLPWGIFWTIEAIAKNMAGGEQPTDANAALLRSVAVELLDSGDRFEARRCLEQSLALENDPRTQTLLWSLDANKSQVQTRGSSETISNQPGSTNHLRPGQAVVGPGAPLFDSPGGAGRAVRTLGEQPGIITAVSGDWLQIIVPGSPQLWVPSARVHLQADHSEDWRSDEYR